MLIALVYQNGNVSEELSGNSELMFYQIENGSVKDKYLRTPSCETCIELAKYLALSQVDLLICGTLPAETLYIMDKEGINLLRGISGKSNETISSYLSGTLDFPAF